MLRQLLMLPVRLAVQVMEIALVTFLAAVSRITSQISSAISAWVSRCKSTLYAAVTVLVVILILVWISIFIYWSFYFSYVPAMSHVKDVNFIFSSCDMRGPCSFPSANMSIVPKGQQSLLMRGQQYSFSLELDMPESPTNRELGMFMVRMDLHSKHGEVVRSAQRAAMITYKSTLFRIAETIFFLPLYLFNFSQQKENIAVSLFNNHIEDPYKPVTGLYIEIESRFIEIYKATLVIEAHFTGIRYILFAWPLTSAFIGISIITFFLSLIALLSWYNLFWNGSQSEAGPSTSRVTFTGDIPTDLTQPETLGLSPSATLSDFEEVEKINSDEKDDAAMEGQVYKVHSAKLADIEEEVLTLRQRNVPS